MIVQALLLMIISSSVVTCAIPNIQDTRKVQVGGANLDCFMLAAAVILNNSTIKTSTFIIIGYLF